MYCVCRCLKKMSVNLSSTLIARVACSYFFKHLLYLLWLLELLRLLPLLLLALAESVLVCCPVISELMKLLCGHSVDTSRVHLVRAFSKSTGGSPLTARPLLSRTTSLKNLHHMIKSGGYYFYNCSLKTLHQL